MTATRASRPSTLRALFTSSRPISWVNTAYPFGAAYLLGTDVFGSVLGVVTFVVGVVYFLVPYNLAMYGINDVFDYESDLRNPRKGGSRAPCSTRACTAPRCGRSSSRTCRSSSRSSCSAA